MFPFRRRLRDEPTRYSGGLWRIWDGNEVVGWLSTDDCMTGWVEVDIAFPDSDPSRPSWDQPWEERVVPIGSEILAGILEGRIATAVLGSTREFRVAWVDDDEFSILEEEHYAFF